MSDKVVRYALVMVLLGLFLWQTYSAGKKYLQRSVTIHVEMKYPETMAFPTVTLCPDSFVDNSTDGSFGGDDVQDFIFAYEHGVYKDKIQFNLSDVDSYDSTAEWTQMPRISYSKDGQIVNCLMYTPKYNFTGGKKSELILYMMSEKFGDLFVFLHEPRQNMLLPQPLYGSAFFQLHPVFRGLKEGEYAMFSYIVSTEVRHAMAKDNLPCEEVYPKDADLFQCFERNVMERAKCRLPWTQEGDGALKGLDAEALGRNCSTPEDGKKFTETYIEFYDYGHKDLYDKLSCIYACEYNVYHPSFVHTTYYSNSSAPAPEYDAVLSISLSPEGVLHMTEVLAYDGYDLIGNVGGFLGLFLGGSILSIYDEIKLKLKHFFPKKVVQSAK